MAADPVLVLGMHRSGTSFLIRALNLAGLWLGDEHELSSVEGRAGPGNPKGNYENRGGITINDAILVRSGGNWLNPPPQLRAEAEDLVGIRSLCQTLERSKPAHFARWGWKDPRTMLTLEVWMTALQRPVQIVGSFRHPAAVARSLLARNGFPVEYSYALWAYYNTLLLNYLQRMPHLLVRFDVDSQTLSSQVLHVCECLGLRSDARSIAAWYDPALVRSSVVDDADDVPAPLEPIWRQLLALQTVQSAGPVAAPSAHPAPVI